MKVKELEKYITDQPEWEEICLFEEGKTECAKISSPVTSLFPKLEEMEQNEIIEQFKK